MTEGKGINLGISSLVITICLALVAGVGSYFSATYSSQNEINLLKLDLSAKTERIVKLEGKVEDLEDLPGKMETLQKTTDETKLIVGIIRDGLIANGTIKPNQR